MRNLRVAGQDWLRGAERAETIRPVEIRSDSTTGWYRLSPGHGLMARESFAALPDPADHPVFRIDPQRTCTSKLLPMPGVHASEPGRFGPGLAGGRTKRWV